MNHNPLKNNKTGRYLIPGLLKGYDENFRKFFQNLLITDYYFGDEKFLLKSEDSVSYDPSLCIYVALHRPNVNFMDYHYYNQEVSLKWLTEAGYIKDSYELPAAVTKFNYDMLPTSMIVIAYPTEKYPNAQREFILGNYKKMYPVSDAIELFYHSEEYSLVVDSSDEIDRYVMRLNKTFKTNIKKSDLEVKPKNLDLPPMASDEIASFRTYYNSDKYQNLSNYLLNMKKLKGRLNI